MRVEIRVATPDDAPALLDIYAPYVRDSAVSFEYAVPDEAAFRARIAATLARYPYLVAAADGEALGYCYTSPFHGRAAYGWCAETSLYIRRDKRGQGLGRALCGALERVSRAQGLLSLYACIAVPEAEDAYLSLDSVRFHTRMGYERRGAFPACGYKFGRWYGTLWMEKRLAARETPPPPFVPFPAMDAAALRDLLREKS